MAAKLLGWIKDTPDPKDRHSTQWLAQMQDLRKGRTSASLRHVRGPRFWQVGQSCVGYALKRAIYMSHRMHGVPLPRPASATFIYTAARRQEAPYTRPLPPLIDRGCHPTLALRGIHSVGFVQALDWPETWQSLTDQPTPMVVRKAYDQHGSNFRWIRIVETHQARVTAVAECLRKGWPVIFGIWCDEAYTQHKSEAPIDAIDDGDIIGGHMQTVLEIDNHGNLIVDNWWDEWGYDNGIGKISPGLFGSYLVDDVFAIMSVPTYTPIALRQK